MQLILESTDELLAVPAVLVGAHDRARRWVGTAGAGGEAVPVQVFIVRIAVATEHEAAFEALLARDPHVAFTGVGDTPGGPSRPHPLAGGAIDARLLR